MCSFCAVYLLLCLSNKQAFVDFNAVGIAFVLQVVKTANETQDAQASNGGPGELLERRHASPPSPPPQPPPASRVTALVSFSVAFSATTTHAMDHAHAGAQKQTSRMEIISCTLNLQITFYRLVPHLFLQSIRPKIVF